MLTRVLTAAVALLLLAACGGSDGADSSSAPSATPAPTESDRGDDTTDEGSSVAGPTAEVPTVTPSPAPSPSPEPEPTTAPLVSSEGVVTIELLTAQSGNDRYALLQWAAVPAATDYTATVFDSDGAPWWAWSGSDLAVPVGGLTSDQDLGGPQAGPGVTWFVVARDADGHLLGTSARSSLE